MDFLTKRESPLFFVLGFVLFCGKHIGADTAKRTLKAFGQILKLCAGLNTLLGSTCFLVVYPPAGFAYIFHVFSPYDSNLNVSLPQAVKVAVFENGYGLFVAECKPYLGLFAGIKALTLTAAVCL